jgi:hypothetical protein
MLKSKTVMVKWCGKNRKHYESKGYKFTKKDDEFEVKIEEVTKGCTAEIEILCDYCLEEGKETIIVKKYNNYRNLKEKNTIKKDCCWDCQPKKNRESCLNKYGVEYSMYTEQYKKKMSDIKKTPYEELVKMFKNKNCSLLLDEYEYKNIMTQKLQYNFICDLHPEYGVQDILLWNLHKQDNPCKKCNSEAISKRLKFNSDYVDERYKAHGLILVNKDNYAKSSLSNEFICEKHKDKGVQKVSLKSLELYGFGCHYCMVEYYSGDKSRHWKGGITPLLEYLRNKIKQWKKDSMKYCNYKCIITGEKFNVIHHLHSFAEIVKETILELDFLTYKTINEYTDEELKLLENKCLEIHYKYPLGVCLCDRVHNLFHAIYKKDGNTTPEQFYEFKERWFKGEFKNII